jgi:DNA-directed RNA polymerase II subunit RPB1
MDAIWIENQNIPLLKSDNSKMDKEHDFFGGQNRSDQEKELTLRKFMHDDDLREGFYDEQGNLNLDAFTDLTKALKNEFAQLHKDREDLRSFIFQDGNDKIALPVNIPRLLTNAKEEFGITNKSKTDLQPGYVLESITNLIDSMK